MGVKSLWEILQDAKSTQSLSDLRGQTVAIDLAEWICEAESVKHMQNAVKNPYLRNLFFRVSILLDNGVQMVFVTDGRPPDLKRDTIAKRLGKESGSFSRGSRSRLNAKFKECCQLLDQIGIPWLKSDGEAEGMCAYLNNNGLVDACVTSDGDVFLYGAQKVYRNFSTDRRNDEIEFYEMETIKQKLNLNRHSLVALALILGCDYCDGLHGIGKVQAQEYLKIEVNTDPLDRLRNLVRNNKPCLSGDKKPSHCSFCKHEGSKKEHIKTGCSTCLGDCQAGNLSEKKCLCLWHVNEKQRKQINLEVSIWEKAKQDPTFPDQNVINEFLRPRKISTTVKFVRKSPDLKKIAETLCDKLDWPKERGVEKALPIVTKWMYSHTNDVDRYPIKPLRVFKERKRDGKEVFEVVWESEELEIEELTSLEPREGFEKAFPEIVKNFLEEKEKLKKQKITKKKAVPKSPKKDRKMTEYFAKKKNTVAQEKSSENVEKNIENEAIEIIDVAPSPVKPEQKTPTKRGDAGLENLASALESMSISYQKTSENHIKLRTQDTDTSSHTQNLSFGLNFSLGSSLLNTPVVARERDRKSHIEGASPGDKENFSPQETKVVPEIHVGTSSTGNVDEPGSPVFMTLAERLKRRELR